MQRNKTTPRLCLLMLLPVSSSLTYAATGVPGNTSSVLTVTAQDGETSATAPVQGYNAKRSATATKTDTPIHETPQAVSVIGREQMEDQGVQSVSQAMRYTAGVVAEESGGGGNYSDVYMLRGFTESTPFIDGLATQTYFSVLSPQVEPYGLERVEVLRGPASVLYGQTAPGGMINLVTKHPEANMQQEVSVQTGNNQHLQGSFDVGGALDDNGKVLYRVTGLARNSGTQTDFIRDKRVYIAPALTFNISDATTLTLLSHYSYRDGDMQPNVLPAEGTLYSNPNGKTGTSFNPGNPKFDEFKRREESIGYEFSHKFNDAVTFRQNARFMHANLDYNWTGDDGLDDDNRTMERNASASVSASDTFSMDNQAEFDLGSGPVSHKILAGVDYLHATDRWAERDGTSSPIDLYDPNYTTDVVLPDVDYNVSHTMAQLGAYLQDQMKYDHWVATLNGRNDWARTETNDLLEDTSSDQKDHKFTYRAGLMYLFDNGVAPYASYSTSFQPSIGNTWDGSALKPTTGKSYEAGIKYQPVGSNSSVLLSVYNIVQNNVLTQDLEHENFDVQTGQVRVRGIELSGNADLSDGVKATAAWTYMQSKQTESNDGYQGNRMADVPAQMASLWVDKTFQSGILSNFGLGAGVRYVGSRYGDDANTLKIGSYTLVDAGVHYDMLHWRLSLTANNLLNRKYVGDCSSLTYCTWGLRQDVVMQASYLW